MTDSVLKALLSLDDLVYSGEWTGAKFKAARQGLPKSAFEPFLTQPRELAGQAKQALEQGEDEP